MVRLLWWVLFLAGWLGAADSAAAAETEIPSCYRILGHDTAQPAPRRELFIVVDQTTPLDADLQREVDQKAQQFLGAGDRIVLVTFSAYAAGQRTRWLLDAGFDPPLNDDARFFLGKNLLARFDNCMSHSVAGLRYLLAGKLREVFAGADGTLPHSDILDNLRRIGREMPAVRGRSRFVLLVSDMLENSDITSFYRAGGLRLLDPDAEMARIHKAAELSDFGGASVYVIGAGITLKDGYKSSREMRSLEDFWRAYFAASNAGLRGFGTPSLFETLGR